MLGLDLFIICGLNFQDWHSIVGNSEGLTGNEPYRGAAHDHSSHRLVFSELMTLDLVPLEASSLSLLVIVTFYLSGLPFSFEEIFQVKAGT